MDFYPIKKILRDHALYSPEAQAKNSRLADFEFKPKPKKPFRMKKTEKRELEKILGHIPTSKILDQVKSPQHPPKKMTEDVSNLSLLNRLRSNSSQNVSSSDLGYPQIETIKSIKHPPPSPILKDKISNKSLYKKNTLHSEQDQVIQDLAQLSTVNEKSPETIQQNNFRSNKQGGGGGGFHKRSQSHQFLNKYSSGLFHKSIEDKILKPVELESRKSRLLNEKLPDIKLNYLKSPQNKRQNTQQILSSLESIYFHDIGQNKVKERILPSANVSYYNSNHLRNRNLRKIDKNSTQTTILNDTTTTINNNNNSKSNINESFEMGSQYNAPYSEDFPKEKQAPNGSRFDFDKLKQREIHVKAKILRSLNNILQEESPSRNQNSQIKNIPLAQDSQYFLLKRSRSPNFEQSSQMWKSQSLKNNNSMANSLNTFQSFFPNGGGAGGRFTNSRNGSPEIPEEILISYYEPSKPQGILTQNSPSGYKFIYEQQ